MPFYYCRSMTRGVVVWGEGRQISLVTMPCNLDPTHNPRGQDNGLDLHIVESVKREQQNVVKSHKLVLCTAAKTMKNPP